MIDATGMPQSAVVIGGTSDIARETLGLLASRRLRRALLTGRDPASLEAVADGLRSRGVSVETETLDVTDTGALDGFASEAGRRLGMIDLVLIAAGDLGTATLDELDAGAVARSVTTNFGGPAGLALAFARLLRDQGSGRIVVLSSVAGVRVRKANFVYGAAKAGLDGFSLGLGDVLEASGVEVTTVRPGFVRTKMTRGLAEAPLAVEAAAVAQAIVRGLETGATIVWVPSSLRPIFGVLKLLPRALWRRMPG
jgi:decaprenylphospho-beta-D-erythro-pentofuranosid-2-ulose 2-reductase